MIEILLIIIIITIMMIIMITIILIVTIWLQTNGVHTSGAAATVINFDGLRKKVRPGTFGKTKVG